jgi:uncharacterized Ntn-hydrolase superfamily protein
MTWSIVARDPETGAFGVAVTTKFFAVGALCPFGAGRIGALATQAFVNPLYGTDGLQLLARAAAPRRSWRSSPRATPAATSASST